jgi:hypothetical protein
MEKTERQIKTFKCEFSDPDFKGLPKKTERLVSNKDSNLLGLGMQVVLKEGRPIGTPTPVRMRLGSS